MRHEVCKTRFKDQRLSFEGFSIKVWEEKELLGTGIEKKQKSEEESETKAKEGRSYGIKC